mmetsp:Transcript_87133/g.233326  ORF Transcript_87133/g.233326 Transcript_87133/m.233326 type:complete len:263 (-) Transcript_87133:145-933(-)
MAGGEGKMRRKLRHGLGGFEVMCQSTPDFGVVYTLTPQPPTPEPFARRPTPEVEEPPPAAPASPARRGRKPPEHRPEQADPAPDPAPAAPRSRSSPGPGQYNPDQLLVSRRIPQWSMGECPERSTLERGTSWSRNVDHSFRPAPTAYCTRGLSHWGGRTTSSVWSLHHHDRFAVPFRKGWGKPEGGDLPPCVGNMQHVSYANAPRTRFSKGERFVEEKRENVPPPGTYSPGTQRYGKYNNRFSQPRTFSFGSAAARQPLQPS